MADFDAGSIEARLELNRDPYIEGLRLSQEEADQLDDRVISPRVDLDAGDAFVEMDDIELRLDEIDGRDATATVNVDVDEARSRIRELENDIGGPGGRGAGGGGLLGSLGFLGPAIARVGIAAVAGSGVAALPGILAAAAGGVLALGGVFTIAASGLAAFGLIAKSDFTDMQNTLKDLTKQQQALNTATTDAQRQAALKAIAEDTAKLQGPAGQAALAYQNMGKAVSALKASTAGSVFPVMASAFSLVSVILPKLAPLIVSTGGALGGVLGQLTAAFSSPGFDKFITFLSTNIGPVLNVLANAFIKLGGGLGTMLEKSQPLISGVLDIITNLADAFNNFAGSPTFDKFVGFIQQVGPQVGAALSPLLKLLGEVGKDLGPALSPALTFIGALGGALVALQPTFEGIVGLFNSLLFALTPLLGPLAGLINAALVPLGQILQYLLPPLGLLISVALPPLTKLFDALGRTLKPLVSDLVTALTPAIKQLGPLFSAFEKDIEKMLKPWQKFFESAQGKQALNEVGTAIKLVFEALTWLLGVIGPVVGFVAQLFVAFDTAGLRIIPPIISGITTAVHDLTNWVETAYNWVVKFVESMYKGALSAFHDVESAFAGAIGWLLQTGKDIINGLWNGIKDAWNDTWGWLVGLESKIFDAIEGIGDSLYNIGSQILHGLWNGMKSVWEDIKGWLSSLNPANWFNDINPQLGHAIINLHPVGQDVFKGLRNGMKDEWNKTTSWLKTIDPSKYVNAQLAGNMKINSSINAVVTAQAQVATLAGISAQLGALTNAVKDQPAAVGAEVTQGLGPVISHQTTRSHMYALQRGRQGAMGS